MKEMYVGKILFHFLNDVIATDQTFKNSVLSFSLFLKSKVLRYKLSISAPTTILLFSPLPSLPPPPPFSYLTLFHSLDTTYPLPCMCSTAALTKFATAPAFPKLGRFLCFTRLFSAAMRVSISAARCMSFNFLDNIFRRAL
jgi:hypothetical protein